MPRETIRSLLLIDGDAGQRRLVSAIAARAGWRTLVADSAADARKRLAGAPRHGVAAILIDQAGPEMPALVAELTASHADVPVHVLATIDNLAPAIEAMRAGASDYLVKPVSPERLLAALEAAASRENEGELRPMAEKLWQPLSFDEIVGGAPAFRAAVATAQGSAAARAPVLIEGERGTGKEMVAEAIHAASPRAQRPLIVVDCGAVPANVIDSALFGHEQGAFAGAFDRKAGSFAEADGGTLFLDDIPALPLDTQARLLAVLESGRIWPLGARGYRDVDVRVVAASRTPLAEEVVAGRFREDLLYRLAGVHVILPPLRERRGDLPALSRHLLDRIARQPGLREIDITADALDLLAGYDWPGNVRQLQNALFRAAVLCDAPALDIEDFPQIQQESFTRRRPRSESPARVPSVAAGGVLLYTQEGHLRALDQIEADVIRLAISHYRGRMSEVARRLGIGRSTLYRKLGDLGIDSAA